MEEPGHGNNHEPSQANHDESTHIELFEEDTEVDNVGVQEAGAKSGLNYVSSGHIKDALGVDNNHRDFLILHLTDQLRNQHFLMSPQS